MKSTIRRILKEEMDINPFNPHNEEYLNAWLNVGDEDMESYREYGIEDINGIIKDFKDELVFPLRIYRGLSKPTRSYDIKYDLVTDPYYDNISWTTKLNVALDFGNVIYSGIVEDINDIDLMYTIERRVMHKPLDEHEIVMKDNSFIKDIRRYRI